MNVGYAVVAFEGAEHFDGEERAAGSSDCKGESERRGAHRCDYW